MRNKRVRPGIPTAGSAAYDLATLISKLKRQGAINAAEEKLLRLNASYVYLVHQQQTLHTNFQPGHIRKLDIPRVKATRRKSQKVPVLTPAPQLNIAPA